ncbi:tlde1 domain-containing protein, partial [Methylobacterium sp. A52T]
GPAAAPVPQAAAAARPSLAWMLDRSPALGAGTATAFGGEAPPVAGFQVAAAAPSPAVREIARQVAQAERARAAQVRMAQAKAAEKVAERVADRTGDKAGEKGTGAPVRMAAAEPTPAALAPVPALVPLPVARPPELRRAPAPPARVASRALPRTRDVFRAAMAEEPSFFEKLFGVGAAAPSQDSRQDSRQEPRQALAYASPDALPQEAPRTRISPEPDSVAGTAVYDITARTVTLPSGEVLEAHSGLGEHMDNPRYVHLRMRGSTPPGTYTLTERERLFHGVRAIRLNPVGGSAAIHGRDGLLAHTYMLRQPGASNGCVSFRDYNRFLQAFLRGEVRRLVVVAGSGDGGGILNRIGLAGRRGGRG